MSFRSLQAIFIGLTIALSLRVQASADGQAARTRDDQTKTVEESGTKDYAGSEKRPGPHGQRPDGANRTGQIPDGAQTTGTVEDLIAALKESRALNAALQEKIKRLEKEIALLKSEKNPEK